MKFGKGDLVTGYEYRLRPRLRLRLLPLLHPRLRPRPRLLPLLRLRPDDLGIVLEAIDKKDAWENFDQFTADEQAEIPNCYVVHWHVLNKKGLVYENEFSESKATH